MREYELIYILNPDLTDARESEIHTRVDGFIEQGKGIFLLRDDWGKRKLAYEIQKLQKGHYFLLDFLGDGSFVLDLERDLRLNPDVLRFLTICVNEKVKDTAARIAEAKTQAAEQQRRREQREREAAERAEREQKLASERDGSDEGARRSRDQNEEEEED